MILSNRFRKPTICLPLANPWHRFKGSSMPFGLARHLPFSYQNPRREKSDRVRRQSVLLQIPNTQKQRISLAFLCQNLFCIMHQMLVQVKFEVVRKLITDRRVNNSPIKSGNSSLPEADNQALESGKIDKNPECILHSPKAISERADGRSLHPWKAGESQGLKGDHSIYCFPIALSNRSG